jgi:malonyl CoA-acyl carrier protein transacylase
MLSVNTGLDAVEEILRRHPSLSVCNFNSHRQFILGGDVEALDDLGRELKQQRIPALRLGVSMAFHHKGMRAVRPQSLEVLLSLSFSPPRVPVLSNVTALPYPDDPQGTREHILDLDENPVQWTRCVARMWEGYGVRHFVEVGPGAVLCGLVEDIQAEALCIPTCRKKKEADALRGAVARLYALGHLRVETLRTVRPRAATNASSTPAVRNGAKTPTVTQTEERIEGIMRAIMKATGYERHELDLQMDLRADLGIRSIHFPILMQELEKHVGQKIGFEHLVGVSTIEELAAVLDAAPLRNEKKGAQEEKTPLPVLRFGFDLTPVAADIAPALFPSTGILLVGPKEKAMRLAKHLNRAEVLPCTIKTLQEALGHPTVSGPELRQSCLVLLCSEHSGPEPWSGLAAFTRLLQAHVADHSGSSFLLVGAPNAAQARAHAAQPSALFEAMTAIILSAAQEHPACRFRSVWLNDGIPAKQGDGDLLISALFSRGGPLQHVLGNERLSTPRLGQRGLDPAGTGLPVKNADVILVSGGAGGIVPHALSELALWAPRLILLGRSRLESVTSVLENDAWNAVRRGGATVEYHACDIRDAENLKTVLADIQARHGRIDGVIHAAGVSDNGPLAALCQEELLTVMDVKCRGLENLLSCSRAMGLRYAVAFSSLAGWLGSFGQAAYAAANRAMACLMEAASVPARVIWLPPISGAGMAENDATRSAMHLKNMDEAWIHCNELGDLIAREILQGQDRQVLLSRYLPALPGVASPLAIGEFPNASPFLPVRRTEGSSTPVWLKALPLPVCESRVEFSRFQDLWIADHRPWPEMDHPLLSAIMELECLFDGARHLAPWRRPSGASDVSWRIPVFCPEGITREGRILARAAETREVCGASLEIRDVTPSWRRRSTWSGAVQASILLESASPCLPPLWEEEIALGNGSNSSMEDMQAFYREKTAFGERYRVLEHCEVQADGWGRAGMAYPACEDFANPERRHAYPVYLLEAAFQLSAIAAARRVLPTALASLRFVRQCTAGEQIRVEIRIIKNEARVVISDAQCRDAAGTVIMTARGITLAEL